MTLALLLFATGRGADNAVPDLKVTLDASADTILRNVTISNGVILGNCFPSQFSGKEVQEIRAGSLRSSQGLLRKYSNKALSLSSHPLVGQKRLHRVKAPSWGS